MAASRKRRPVPLRRTTPPKGLSLLDYATYGYGGRLAMREHGDQVRERLADLDRRARDKGVSMKKRRELLRDYARRITMRKRTGFQNKMIADTLDRLRVVPSPADYEYIGESP